MASIEQIDCAIGRYYGSLNKEYNNNFATYCDENGIDAATLITEIDEDPDSSMLVEFLFKDRIFGGFFPLIVRFSISKLSNENRWKLINNWMLLALTSRSSSL